MYSTTKARLAQILVWLFWFLALLTLAWAYDLPIEGANITLCLSQAPTRSPALDGPGLLSGIVTHDPRQGPLFPWQPRRRWRKLALQHYRAARRAYRRALWAARLARLPRGISIPQGLLLRGAWTMAALVDLLTRAQLRRHLGALPVLYALLEILQVRQIINRHVPTAAQVDHGTVALVLILNRLSAPRPLYRVADWLALWNTLFHRAGSDGAGLHAGHPR